ncbi:AMP-binding protein [Burkholderia dolosa]|uniref:Long-chain-fatty-acid--CoA ligase n=1 Tax=Burkholderia dolosa TaxID=152500 RepID=A0A892I2D4_9BURK|nr:MULTISPECIES: AMP-binding protein [Burkholderia]AKE03849.1 long-chain fatty acid--CoA ligase [Burkholderia cepacia]AJY13548.1 AMP-binding enzyme family protein [Burkholderia dolosa AU0158]AYZ98617.1 long-chain fatty acid--CoA ligase [Burkholderia dolosa]EAY68996.1 Acyl-CoA synthetases (AMP-forming)/AMP-acid ligase II [Burkholderia dolosa AU0158]ETP65622.1 long-chain fatty acid--CoA ligase [Burkholderia dolosa PC543]
MTSNSAATATTPLAPNTDGIWYASYPPGVPHEIDVTQYTSLVQFFDECTTRFAERVAYVSAGASMTYRTLAQKVDAFASYLQSIGIQPGDRVAIMLPNTFQYPVALFGTLKAGAIVVNVNPLYTVRELAHQLKDSGAQTIVVFENFARTLQDALPDTQVRNIVVTALGDLLADGLNAKGRLINFVLKHVKKLVPPYRLPQAVRLRSALALGARSAPQPVPMTRDDLAFLQYTGGTTGVAKGAMLTHGNLIANLLQAKAWIADQVTGDVETVLTPLPLYHIYSLTVNAFIFMGLGGRNILIANPRDTNMVMKIIRNETFTGITGINTLYNAFLDNDEFRKRDFSKLKLAMAGGMAMQRAVAERFQQVTGRPIVEGYGLTECSPIVTMNPVDLNDMAAFSGSIGLPAPSTVVRFRREDGTWAGIGEPGELCVRGPQVMRGYWQRPDETAKAIDADGWLGTGDIGVMDERGFIRLIDRKKDMILVSGFNVYPNEIEEVLVMHPGISEAAAIGIPDDVHGERIKVFVVRRDPALTVDDVLAHCRKNLTGYKMPKLVEFRDALPQTNVGKILRRALRDEELAKIENAQRH